MASGELPKRREDEKDVTVKEGEVNALVDGGATASNSTCTRGDLYIFAPDRIRVRECETARVTSCWQSEVLIIAGKSGSRERLLSYGIQADPRLLMRACICA